MTHTEDSPTQHWTYDADCSHEISPTTLHCTKCGHSSKFIMEQSALPPKQDDKELREAIDQAIQDHLIIGVDSGQAYFHETDFAVDAILALFQKEQIQLVTELIELKDLTWKLDDGTEREYVPVSALEHKKQELEGRK